MISKLNGPYCSESFAGDEMEGNLVVGGFETAAYLANKGLVKPWQRNKRIELIDASDADNYIPQIGNWKNDTID